MDIGNQQRVIIVELDQVTEEEPVDPIAAEVNVATDLESAATWPLPLDLDLEPVS